MSLVLIHGLHRARSPASAGSPGSTPSPARARPRRGPSSATPVEIELPSYFGDLVNRRVRPRCPQARPAPDGPRVPARGDDAQLHPLAARRRVRRHPPPRALGAGFLEHADLTPEQRAQYQNDARHSPTGSVHGGPGRAAVDGLSRVEFFTSHEGLNLLYESAQTRRVPRRPGWYDLTTHLPWIGERTRQIDGAHVEFFRGIANPVGVKIGPTADPADVLALVLDGSTPRRARQDRAHRAHGRVKKVETLPPILEQASTRASTPSSGSATRCTATASRPRPASRPADFDDILTSSRQSLDIHDRVGTWLGGVHFELTGEDVTECVGGAVGLDEDNLREELRLSPATRG
jgi:3-deoxy-7-phosphoheptulonate synthase